MTRLRHVLGWAAILVATSGCAAHSRHDRAPSADRNLLTQEDLREHRFATVFDAIEALRSHWLRERGPDSFSTPGQVQVYLDDSRLGGVEALRALPLANVLYIRHVNGVDAAARWGLDHGQGVILVSTRR
jgi:hypothetical protein